MGVAALQCHQTWIIIIIIIRIGVSLHWPLKEPQRKKKNCFPRLENAMGMVIVNHVWGPEQQRLSMLTQQQQQQQQ